MENVSQYALEMLYKALKATRIALAYAEKRNARQDEIDSLNKKIAAVDWLIGLVLKEV